MQVFIKNISGKSICFDVRPQNTVGQLKIMIQEREGISPDQQRLLFSGQQLEDDFEVEHYKLSDGSLVHLVLRLLGG
ncbi:uncharacterized protein LACBIDRAFT_238699, partial [Laccaria bicolor S238N-H82]